MANTGYREKKEGPIRLVYAGSEHVGNIIEPTFGGAKDRAQSFKAISRHWGRSSNHPSKHAAMTWLQSRHGAAMKIESTDQDSPHDVLRDNGWKKAVPYGFKYHVAASQKAKYTHPDLPGHHINVSYTNGTWQHHESPHDSQPRVGMGAKSLHGLLGHLHASKTINGIKEFVQHIREENPDDWREAVYIKLRENKGPDSFHQTNESFPEQMVQGSTPHSTMQKAVKRSKVSIVKKDVTKAVTSPTYDSVKEEFDDWEKEDKDPRNQKNKGKVDPKTKVAQDDKQGPKPTPADDAESELQIKRTMTGEPGDTVEINPMMKRPPNTNGATFNPSTENKKRPNT